jgi:membrane associated rhomboid family serine protease
MFLPIGDENPRERTPYVNYALLAANIVVFLLYCFPQPSDPVLISYAIVPAAFEPHTLFTSMFLHAGLMHLAGNMLFLWICGDNVEDRLGHVGYAVFYLACGLAAGYAHLLTTRNPEIPTLGASGAISGVLAAYVVFFPFHRIKMLLWFFFYIDRILVPAWAWIGFWFAEQIFFSSRGIGGVAYMAHIGGFVAGLVVALPVRLLFQSRRPEADLPASLLDSSRSGEPGPLLTLDEDPGVVYLDDPPDRFAVLRIGDDLHSSRRIAGVVAAATGEPLPAVARRLDATRGLFARRLSRIEAERLQRELRALGVDAAVVADGPRTAPPAAVPVEAADWDDDALRFRAGGADHVVPWALPFLYVAARVEGVAVLDVFATRQAAFRFAGKPGAVARAVLENRRGAVLNEGVRSIAYGGAWGWLDFRSARDYDDYVFWLYNLVLSRVPIHRG